MGEARGVSRTGRKQHVMMRILAGVAVVALAAAAAGAAWYYRPWSDYSPARIAANSTPEAYPTTFRTMDAVFPYRPIGTVEAPDPLPRALGPLAVSYDWRGETRSLGTFLEAASTMGLIVLKDGVVVHETYRLGAGPSDRFTSWSVGKSFVATLVAMAMRDGLIDSLDDPASRYAPQYAGSDYGETSLRHLLMMSAGVEFNEDYGAPDSDIDPFFFNAFIRGRDVDEMAMEIERTRPAGSDLHYVSPNTHVLSAVVRGAYGRPLAEIVEAKIWRPLAMSDGASWSQNVPGPRGMAIGYCCLNARLEDYARFGQLYAQDGVWNGERLLPEGWVEMATTPQAPFQAPGATYDFGYGLHFWIPQDADGEFAMLGVFGQTVWVDARRDIVIARAAADPEFGARRAEEFAVMRAIADAVAEDGAAAAPDSAS